MAIGNPLYLLAWVCILALVIWGVFTILAQLTMPPVVRTIITLIVAILMLVWLFQILGVF